MSSLTSIALLIFIFGGFFLVLFIIFGLRPLLRMYVRSTGERASATILERRLSQGTVYSGNPGPNMVAQNIILKLEVHPANKPAYIVEDRFMAKYVDFIRLTVGCDLQVSIARNNPNWVVSLPETVTVSSNAPIRAQGVRTFTPSTPDDPKAKLEKLNEMLKSGLITQKEFDTKKAEILSKM